MDFTFKIEGVEETERSLKNFADEVANAREPLRQAAEIVVQESVKNFDNQGYTYGKAWKPLKDSTRRQRASMGYNAARPILVRSGKLKRGARVKYVTDKEAVVENPVDYAKYPQFGTKYAPQRVILDVTEKISAAIGILFTRFIGDKIRK